jgi:adenylate kinase family enzyme
MREERIFITGPAGVGKSTYARRLAKEKSLKCYQLDQIRYPNGKKIEDKDFRERLRDFLSKDSWILEGTPKNSCHIIFPRCTSIIFLKASRLTCTLRTAKRTIKRALGLEESPIFNDLRNIFSKEFIVFRVWKKYPDYMKQIEEGLLNTKYTAEVIEEEI